MNESLIRWLAGGVVVVLIAVLGTIAVVSGIAGGWFYLIAVPALLAVFWLSSMGYKYIVRGGA